MPTLVLTAAPSAMTFGALSVSSGTVGLPNTVCAIVSPSIWPCSSKLLGKFRFHDRNEDGHDERHNGKILRHIGGYRCDGGYRWRDRFGGGPAGQGALSQSSRRHGL